MADEAASQPFTSPRRKDLFLDLADRPDGASVSEVYGHASELGDTVTEEAYYNIARRLVHRGLLVQFDTEKGPRYRRGAPADKQWLEEEELSALIDPDYPLLAVTIWKESRRQINEIPEELWIELRERLRNQNARDLFRDAILSYSDEFHAQIGYLAELEKAPTSELPHRRQEAENSRRSLLLLTKYGLGLSRAAVEIPADVRSAVASFDQSHEYVNRSALEAELTRRVASEPFIVEFEATPPEKPLLIGAVDGSTRGGMLSFVGEEGDLPLGHAPLFSINTAIGVIDRLLPGSKKPLFIRLPEKPEDMQRQDNRYSVMAKLLYPDMSDAQYMHSVWNAMDVIESRAALRLLRRWTASSNVEVPGADVVLRDGTVTPQDRDFFHYSDLDSYGRIVREMIELNWELAKQCREDGHTLAGVVKQAQLSVFSPVINWFACQLARQEGSQVAAWPLQTMNLIPDQVLLTRLLTTGRRKKDPWIRSCTVLRPFHALTNYARTYTGGELPSAAVMRAYQEALAQLATLDQEKRVFWESLFRGENDPYVKLLDNAVYGSFFLGAVPRLDIDKNLPRIEFLIPVPPDASSEELWHERSGHLARLLAALLQNGFDVSAEHTMFKSDAALDVLPRLLIRAHDTVKHWAAELLSRVQEYVGYYLARYVKTKRFRGIKVRPFTRGELTLLYDQLKRERELQAGAEASPRMIDE